MWSPAIDTLVRMMESLPASAQDRVVEHLREYIADLHDETEWEAAFERTLPQLEAAARQAKGEIAVGYAEPLDHSRL